MAGSEERDRADRDHAPGAARGEDDPVMGRTVGAFVVDRKLGEGGMGAVYRLRHRELPGTYQALKVLTLRVRGADSDGAAASEIVDRFLQEARAAAAVGSHRVAQIFDIGQFDDGVRYLVMEYVGGRSLADTLVARGPLPVLEALLVATRVADTLAVAHQRGIIHRDIKPSNLMLLSEGRDPVVKVLDFGIARATGDIKMAFTTERRVIGSPGYMSPEAALGMPVDGRADVFSLAVTLFEMLAGRIPFGGDNMQQAIMNTITGSVPPIAPLREPGLDPVPARVEQLLLTGLAKEPEGRPAMAGFLAALVELSDELAAQQRRGAVAESVMRSFAPVVAERPTLVAGAPEVAEVLARYSSDAGGRSEARARGTPPPASAPPPDEAGAVPVFIPSERSPGLPAPAGPQRDGWPAAGEPISVGPASAASRAAAARPSPAPAPEIPGTAPRPDPAAAGAASRSPAAGPGRGLMVAAGGLVAVLAAAATLTLLGPGKRAAPSPAMVTAPPPPVRETTAIAAGDKAGTAGPAAGAGATTGSTTSAGAGPGPGGSAAGTTATASGSIPTAVVTSPPDAGTANAGGSAHEIPTTVATGPDPAGTRPEATRHASSSSRSGGRGHRSSARGLHGLGDAPDPGNKEGTPEPGAAVPTPYGTIRGLGP